MKDTSNTGAGDTAAPREDRDSASRARAKSSPRDASAEKSSAGGFGEGLEGKASSPKKTTKKTTRRRPKAKPDASDSAPASSSSDGGAGSDEAGAKLDRRRNRSSASVKAAKAKSAEGNDAGEKPKRPRRPRKRAAARADSDSQEPQNDGDRDSGANESSDAPKRPRRKRGSRKSKAPRGSSDQDGGEAAAESSESSEDSPREEGTSKRRRGARGGRRKKASGDLAKDQDASERKPRSRSKKKVKVKKRGRRTRKDSVRNQPVAMEFLPGEEDDLPELTALPEDAELVEESGRKGRRKTKKKGEKGVTTTTIKDVPRDQVILVNAVDKLESRVALVHEKRIHDLYLEVNRVQSYVHNIYRGKVVNIEAAIGAAFVDFGQGKNGFLHVSDVLPEYGEKGWDLSKLLEAREGPNDDVDLSGVESVESDEEAEGKSRKNSKGRGRKERSGKRPMIGDLLKVGDKVVSTNTAQEQLTPGLSLPLSLIPPATFIHCIEIEPGKGGQLARSAGGFAQLLGLEAGRAILRMPSGEQRYLNADCRATVGIVGNVDHHNASLGKAGRSRWKGIRPRQRGMSMNPVDHPNGGGGGKKKGGGGRQHLASPWGVLSKGFRTRKKFKLSNRFIVVRRDGRPMKQK